MKIATRLGTIPVTIADSGFRRRLSALKTRRDRRLLRVIVEFLISEAESKSYQSVSDQRIIVARRNSLDWFDKGGSPMSRRIFVFSNDCFVFRRNRVVCSRRVQWKLETEPREVEVRSGSATQR